MRGSDLVFLISIIFPVSLSAAALHQPLSGIRWEDRSLLAMRGEFEAEHWVFLVKSGQLSLTFVPTALPPLPLPT